MDVVTVSPYGVRSVVLRLKHRDHPLRFTLYPMIHLAEQSFYDAVRERLVEHDLIVAEGILGDDSRVRMLTRAYRMAGGQRRLGLVEQTRAVVDVGVPVVWADMTLGEFRTRWRSLPWLERLVLWCYLPFLGGWLWLFGSRHLLATHLAIDDDILDDRAGAPRLAIERLLTHDRDALLAAELERLHATHSAEHLDVAVVYGAYHVWPAVAFLHERLGYVVRSGEYLTVFE